MEDTRVDEITDFTNPKPKYDMDYVIQERSPCAPLNFAIGPKEWLFILKSMESMIL